MQYREATILDVPAMAAIRSTDQETLAYWKMRIAGYMNAQLHPQKALLPRIVYLAIENEKVVGFIAGHLTQRFECEGELQWIDVIAAYRRRGIASGLLHVLATWFAERKASTICVNAAADNTAAQTFYKSNGAEDLGMHWLVWKDISSLKKK